MQTPFLPPAGRILVTGGCGFIGAHLVRALALAGYRIRILDDLSTGQPGAVGSLPGVELVRGSVLDPAATATAARGADLVVHLAGVVGMRLAVGDSGTAYRVASEGTRVLLGHTGTAPAVLVSSSAVYGLSDGRTAMSESLPIDRAAPLAYDGGRPGYATGKWELERLGATADRPVLVVRPFNVVGPGQRARYGMVLPTFLDQASRGVPLSVYGDGSQRRCFSDVGGFVRVLLRLVDTPVAWRPGRNVFNIGSATETTIRELAELVLAATGSGAGLRYRPYQDTFPGRTDVTGRVPSLDRLHSVVGDTAWLPTTSIVKDMVEAGNRRG
jgi:UDP-glucose 4-epimerase